MRRRRLRREVHGRREALQPLGTAIQQCDLSGIWQDTAPCPFACTGSGDASACAGMCKPGTRSCGASNAPVLCDVMGMNQTQAPCDNACLDGVCWVIASQPRHVAPPEAANKVETCSSIASGPARYLHVRLRHDEAGLRRRVLSGMANRLLDEHRAKL